MPSTTDARNVLIIIAHPVPGSLSHALVDQIANKFVGSKIRIKIADLHAEGFAPAMTAADIGLYRGTGQLTPDIAAEHARIEWADMLLLVFPVYWWSVPALLKGWFERVFTGGWAYKIDADGRVVGNMRDIPVRLIATGAGDELGYDRHGYAQAIRTQILEGVFGFCGVKDVRIATLLEADDADLERLQQFASGLGPFLGIDRAGSEPSDAAGQR